MAPGAKPILFAEVGMSMSMKGIPHPTRWYAAIRIHFDSFSLEVITMGKNICHRKHNVRVVLLQKNPNIDVTIPRGSC